MAGTIGQIMGEVQSGLSLLPCPKKQKEDIGYTLSFLLSLRALINLFYILVFCKEQIIRLGIVRPWNCNSIYYVVQSGL
jgi:hypothetical protein